MRYRETYRFDDIADRLYVKMHAMTVKTELLRKAVLEEGQRLDEHCYYVDAEYILYPIPYVETISFLPDFVYMYRIGRQGQSVSLSKMRKNEENYRRVLQSLFRFYDRCRMGGTSEPQGGGRLSCSKGSFLFSSAWRCMLSPRFWRPAPQGHVLRDALWVYYNTTPFFVHLFSFNVFIKNS